MTAFQQPDIPHRFFARIWPAINRMGDARGVREHRRRLLAGLAGRVIEVGPGDGANFAHYPATVTEVVAVEPEPSLRAVATRAAATAPAAVRVVPGTADGLPVEDESVDGAVASLVLCSVPDQATALAELRRVLRPGGELRFYEHVAAEGRVLRGMQRGAQATFWPRLFGNCHPARDTGAAIRTAGFEVLELERFDFKDGALELAIPHILGRARRAA